MHTQTIESVTFGNGGSSLSLPLGDVMLMTMTTVHALRERRQQQWAEEREGNERTLTTKKRGNRGGRNRESAHVVRMWRERERRERREEREKKRERGALACTHANTYARTPPSPFENLLDDGTEKERDSITSSMNSSTT